jgi:DNA-binding beta-propeller fold protein YncE
MDNNTVLPGNWFAGQYINDFDTNPGMMAYDSGKGEIFVTDRSKYNLSVISCATDKIVATIVLGSEPRSIAYDSGKGEVFVGEAYGGGSDIYGNMGNVTVISDATNSIIANIPTGMPVPGYMAYDSVTNNIFIVTFDGNYDNVTVISDSTNKVAGTASYDFGPSDESLEGIAYDYSNGNVYVASGDNLTVISGVNGGVVGHIGVGGYPGGSPISVVYDSANGEVFAAKASNVPPGNVSIVSNTVIYGTISNVSEVPDSMAYDSADRYVFVTNSTCPETNPACSRGNVTVFSDLTDTVIAHLQVGGLPEGTVYDPENGETYVSDAFNDAISVISSTPTLAYVSITTDTATVATGGSSIYSASVSCDGGTCPSGEAYTWSLSNSLGTLSSTSGSSVTFTAGPNAGTTDLTVAVTLNGTTEISSTTITITGGSSSGNNGSNNFSGTTLLIIVVVVVAAIAISVVLLIGRRKKRISSKPGPQYTTPPYQPAAQSPSGQWYVGTPPPLSPQHAPPASQATNVNPTNTEILRPPAETPNPKISPSAPEQTDSKVAPMVSSNVARSSDHLVCRSCGHPLKVTTKFCGSCGTKVET